MLRRSKAPRLALVVVLAALAAAAEPARAAIEFTIAPGGSAEMRSEGRLTFQGGLIRVACRVTFRGRLLTSALSTARGTKFGELTEARIEECEGGTLERVLIGERAREREREPWELNVSALLGTLPETINGLLYNITRLKLQFSALGLRCLYEGTAGLLLTLRREEDFGFTAEASRFLESTYRLVTGAGCPESGTMRGSMTFSPGQALKMRAPLAVSVGDSYISGEAGRWAGNSRTNVAAKIDALGETAYNDAFDRSGETIAFCHRSWSAEIFIGELWGKNLACTGARTRSFVNERGHEKPGLDFETVGTTLGQAQLLQDFAEQHREIKLVAVSIGGNDFEFGWIVEQCVRAYLFPTTHLLCSASRQIGQKLEAGEQTTNKRRIKQGLLNIRTAMREAGINDEQYTIVVQNYPSPIPKGREFRIATREGEAEPEEEETQEEWEEIEVLEEFEIEEEEEHYRQQVRQSQGGCGFWNADATWANQVALPRINRVIAEAIAETGLTIVKLRIEGALTRRRLCERTVASLEGARIERWDQFELRPYDETEWVSKIYLPFIDPVVFAIQESLHPNYWAQLALRNCLRRTYNGGAPREGTCRVTAGGGVNGLGEPNMELI